MRYKCTIKQLIDGRWQAKTQASDVGPLECSAQTAEEAVERLRTEIRYRLEWCPCSGVADDYVQLEVVEAPPTRWRGTVF